MKHIALLVTFVIVFQFTVVVGQDCPAGSDCSQVNCTGVVACPLGFYCAANEVPIKCPSGYYCPQTDVKIECPSGYFCPEQSYKPLDCIAMGACETGSHRYFFWGGLLFFILISGGSFGLLIAKVRYHRAAAAPPSQPLQEQEMQSVVDIKKEVKHNVSVNIKFENIGSVTKPLLGAPKTIVTDITGQFESGKVTLVMGPSGAGKTSLLNVLVGKLPKTSGTIQIGTSLKLGTATPGALDPDQEKESESTMAAYKKLVGFVPQEDIMLRTLTVSEILTHSALTRLPREWSTQEKRAKVEEVMHIMNLYHLRHRLIGDRQISNSAGLSGGERKRVNIAMELVADPLALFLDEPTSGLDSSSSKEVMKYLNKVAHETGITVAAVVHQPRYEIFQSCDKVLILAKGGYTAYYGPCTDTLGYFSEMGFDCPKNTNPADFFLDVVSGKHLTRNGVTYTPVEFNSKWKESIHKDNLRGSSNSAKNLKQQPSKVTTRNTASIFYQTWLFAVRALEQQWRAFGLTLVDLGVHAFAGLIMSIAFLNQLYQPPLPFTYRGYCPAMADYLCTDPTKDDLARLGVYMVMALGLCAVTIATRTFSNEQSIYKREFNSGMSTTAYFVGKCLADVPRIVGCTLIYLLVFFLIKGPLGDFWEYFATILLLELTIYGVGYIASMLVPKEHAALTGAVAALLSGLGTGAVNSVDDMGPIGNVPWSRWAGEALYLVELKYDDYPDQDQQTIKEAAKRLLGYEMDNFGYCLGVLVIFIFVTRLVALILMLCQLKWQRK